MDMKNPQAGREARMAPIAPAIDVFEDEDGIVLRADLPGVSKESLEVRVEGETLTIAGQVSLGEAKTLGSVYAEVRVADYRRELVLSRDLDSSRIDAAIKDGVLQVRVPKLEQARPRRVPVRVE